jgi:hypothetical protein
MDIINKIKDLFALASSTSSLDEAATATALAQKLLDKYQLSLADLASSKQENVIEEFVSKNKRDTTWKGKLIAYLAGSNYTRALFFQGLGYKLIGRKSDIELVSYFWKSIVAQIDQLADNAIKNGVGSGKRFSNSFKYGAAQAVIDRLKTARAESKKEAERTEQGKSGLIWLSKKNEEVERYLNRYKHKTIVKKPDVSYNAYAAGVAAGQQVNLATGLKTKEVNTKLLGE